MTPTDHLDGKYFYKGVLRELQIANSLPCQSMTYSYSLSFSMCHPCGSEIRGKMTELLASWPHPDRQCTPNIQSQSSEQHNPRIIDQCSLKTKSVKYTLHQNYQNLL